MSEDTGVAEKEVKVFHQKLDAGQYDSLYAESADDLKKAAKREDFIAFLDAVHRKLGAIQASEKTTWRVNSGTGGEIVLLGYKTKFAEGDAQENFTFRISDGSAILVGYHINSNALIVK